MAITPAEIEREKQRLPRGSGRFGKTLEQLSETTNVVLAATSRRLIAVSAGIGGAPRDHVAMPYEGLEIDARAKKQFVLGWPDTQMGIRGAHSSRFPSSSMCSPPRPGLRPPNSTADGSPA